MKTKVKLNKKKFGMFIIMLVVVLTSVIYSLKIAIDFVQFPEKYSATWKYQLANDIERGNEEAIDYYNKNYVEKGEKLW